MNNSLIEALRRAAAGSLPGRAFLRRDRGNALFVTDAPRIAPGMDWSILLSEAGFYCFSTGGLLRLLPKESWLTRLEAAFPDPPDDLCAGLLRFRGRSPDGESLRLFILGAKCLDGEPDAARYDRLLRQRAAACLRMNRMNPDDAPRGGGLYACALIDHMLQSHS